MVVIPDDVRRVLDQPVYAHLATVSPDGSPQVSVIWIERDGDLVRFGTAEGRVKVRNMRHDQRVMLSLTPPGNPGRNITIRGHVAELVANGTALMDRLARKYEGAERFRDLEPGEVRLDATIEVDRVSDAG
jgi:PPOX class probable F420-dependent enzyme